MSDSDDENFVTFGEPLEPLDEENLPRKKPITVEEQIATDAQGRRRFHGAFTGGFSAGYFNTVGTRDGWRPQQFKSSRSSKAGTVNQLPEDFMDEEDTGEFGIAPTGIRASSDYTGCGKGTKRERQRANDGPIPGVPVLQDLLKPISDTVGVALLKKMGWKPGQGVGPRVTRREKQKTRERNDKKVYGCSLPTQESKDSTSESSDDDQEGILFAPDDYEPYRLNPKDNYFGIGYSGLDRTSILGHINLFDSPTLQLRDKNKKFSIKGQAFGVGAFEADDEDIYARDDMSRYDFTLGPETQKKAIRPSESSTPKNSLEGFVPATNALQRKKHFPSPDLPKDFKPVHRVRKSRFSPADEPLPRESVRRKGLGRHDMTANDRSVILGESSSSVKPKPLETLEKPPGKPSPAANIISRTLNLHGRDSSKEREALALQQRKCSTSWLDKLTTTSFVSAGVEGAGESSGSLKNLSEFKSTQDGSKSPTIDGDPLHSDIRKNDRSTRLGESPIPAKPNTLDQPPDKSSPHEGDQLKARDALALQQGKSSSSWLNKLTTTSFVSGGMEGTKSSGSLKNLSEFKWNEGGSKPFALDEEKQRRFEKYQDLAKNDERNKLSIIQPLSMTEWERERESEEFEQALRLCSGPRTSSSNEVVAKDPMVAAAKVKMFGKLTRATESWQPSSIVCKRFNIPEPKTGCAKPEGKAKKYSVFESLDFCGGDTKFQKATDTAGTYKEPHIPYNPPEGNKVERVLGAVQILDTSDIDTRGSKSMEKIRDFEASYGKVFGKSEESEGEGSPGEKDEKTDLFKAIFLSSSEDEATDEDDDVNHDTVKSVLIGKSIGDANPLRNDSPPRGIFAKLDLDELVKPGGSKKIVGRDIEIRKIDGAIGTDEGRSGDVANDVDQGEMKILPQTYGPALPGKSMRADDSGNPEIVQRPVFRSVVVTKLDGGDKSIKWIEKRVKKERKKKHKHKEKEKRHRHKSKKSKR
ncbi:G patch domain-containing protein 1 homolog [Diachasmimorpha longicaudata]|uniref:G patch domain-containing protein 1 homolog n=1 Tax=Diachasmimorpha longicaudata TaxID=58733 RepID=UPI0030B90660